MIELSETETFIYSVIGIYAPDEFNPLCRFFLPYRACVVEPVHPPSYFRMEKPHATCPPFETELDKCASYDNFMIDHITRTKNMNSHD